MSGEMTAFISVIAGVLGFVFFVCFVFFVWGATLGERETEIKYQKQAIERGYGLYCPTDGNFAWVGECEKSQ